MRCYNNIIAFMDPQILLAITAARGALQSIVAQRNDIACAFLGNQSGERTPQGLNNNLQTREAFPATWTFAFAFREQDTSFAVEIE